MQRDQSEHPLHWEDYRCWRSCDWQYPGNLRQPFAEIPLNPMMQRHRAARAAVAGPVEAYMHHTIGHHIHQFDISAISLDGRSNQVNHFLYPRPHFGTIQGYRRADKIGSL